MLIVKDEKQMQVCHNCGKENANAEIYCYACGHILPAALAGEIDDTTGQLDIVPDTIDPQRRWGTAYFDRQNELQLTFRNTNESIVIDLNREVVVGRFHTEPNTPLPDIDLTPFGALEDGVSRQHLKFAREHDTMVVTDLGSSNSTYLNGQRLMPYEPRILRDNDELRLGRLVVRVAFV